MITHSDSIKAISKALLTFQGAVDGVEKNKTNPGFKSRYANLEAVRDTAVPELQKVGIVYAQSPGKIMDGIMSMTTMLIHAESGEWMKFEGDITLGKRDPQGTGSAMTYMQRYSLMAALGLPPVDDDGEGAMERTRPINQITPIQSVVAATTKGVAQYSREIKEATLIEPLQAVFKELWRSDLSGADKQKLKDEYEARKLDVTANASFDKMESGQ